MDRPLLIASDHAGFELKEKLKRALEGMGVPYRDLGVASADPVDYPDQAHALADQVSRGDAERILKVWLETPFAGGRHAARVAKIEAGGSELM